MSFVDIAMNVAFEERFEDDRYFIAFRKRWGKEKSTHIIPVKGDDYIALCGKDLSNETWVDELLARETCAECATIYTEKRVKAPIVGNGG